MRLSRSEFDKLALEHLDMLYRLARRMTRDANRAEDLVQDTYLRAFAASDSSELKAYGIRPWLIRILRHVHFSKAQREKRQPMPIDSENLNGSADADQASDSSRAPALWDSGSCSAAGINVEAMDERLAAEVEKLPNDYQAVLLLWAVDELSYKEIADACDVPIGTVMSRLHRARSRLAKQLSDFAKNERILRE